MKQWYASDVRLDDVAREIATSRRQLQRVLEEVGDTTFREHLARIRMAKAAAMMSSPLPIHEIARRVGYRQPAQFAKAFRRIYGVTPSAYRDRAR